MESRVQQAAEWQSVCVDQSSERRILDPLWAKDAIRLLSIVEILLEPVHGFRYQELPDYRAVMASSTLLPGSEWQQPAAGLVRAGFCQISALNVGSGLVASSTSH